MEQILYDEVPSLNLANFIQGDRLSKESFIQDLGAAYTNIGFAAVKNHYLSEELTQDLYRVVKEFFALPEEIKKKYEIPGIHGQRGYTGKGKEHAKGRSTGDLKEFYHIGQIVEDGDPIQEEYPANVWPAELPEFREIGIKVFRQLERTGMEMLRAIALYLSVDENYFGARIKNGNSILRPIHYYPIQDPDAVPPDAVRAAEHGDINLITLLMGASAEGLEVYRKDGKWIPITALPDQLVVNVGDMLERLTNGRLKSTLHRVVNPSREKMNASRYSIPFFMHPRSEMDLSCLKTCVDAEHPKGFEDITAGEFLNKRLEEIGLKK